MPGHGVLDEDLAAASQKLQHGQEVVFTVQALADRRLTSERNRFRRACHHGFFQVRQGEVEDNEQGDVGPQTSEESTRGPCVNASVS